jgi:hypothetical protein
MDYGFYYWLYASIGLVSGFFAIDAINIYSFKYCENSKTNLKSFIYKQHNKLWFRILILGISIFLWIPVLFIIFNFLSEGDNEMVYYDYNIIEILIKSGIASSNADAKRLIYQGKVKVNGITHNGKNIFDPVELKPGIEIECRNKVVTYDKLQYL